MGEGGNFLLLPPWLPQNCAYVVTQEQQKTYGLGTHCTGLLEVPNMKLRGSEVTPEEQNFSRPPFLSSKVPHLFQKKKMSARKHFFSLLTSSFSFTKLNSAGEISPFSHISPRWRSSHTRYSLNRFYQGVQMSLTLVRSLQLRGSLVDACRSVEQAGYRVNLCPKLRLFVYFPACICTGLLLSGHSLFPAAT